MAKSPTKPTPRLGKGLNALVSKRPAPSQRKSGSASPEKAATDTALPSVPVSQVHPNPRQPRSVFNEAALEELAASIRQHGVMQPLVVRHRSAGGYELIAGERRLRAAQLAGLGEVPVVIRAASDSESLELALIENLQREDLSAIERAVAYRMYMDETGVSAEALAERLGQSRANVVNYIRLLALGDEIQAMVNRGELAMGQARAIAGVADPQRQLAIARLAVRRNLSARQVEDLARKDVASAPQRPIASADIGATSQHLAEIERFFAKALGLKVKLQSGRKKNAGRIIIHYENLEDFDRLAELLGVNTQIER